MARDLLSVALFHLLDPAQTQKDSKRHSLTHTKTTSVQSSGMETKDFAGSLSFPRVNAVWFGRLIRYKQSTIEPNESLDTCHAMHVTGQMNLNWLKAGPPEGARCRRIGGQFTDTRESQALD